MPTTPPVCHASLANKTRLRRRWHNDPNAGFVGNLEVPSNFLNGRIHLGEDVCT